MVESPIDAVVLFSHFSISMIEKFLLFHSGTRLSITSMKESIVSLSSVLRFISGSSQCFVLRDFLCSFELGLPLCSVGPPACDLIGFFPFFADLLSDPWHLHLFGW